MLKVKLPKRKLKIAVLFGGKSSERKFSLMSARSVMKNLDKSKYKIIPVKISKHGEVPIIPRVDVVFPVLYGKYGEDGTMQGYLELLNIPYVGCGVLSSAICLDKVIQKQICQQQGIRVIDYVYITNYEWKTDRANFLKNITKLKYPIFVKPANMSYSAGTAKVNQKKDLFKAIQKAFKFSDRVIAEKAVRNSCEIECAILGNNKPKAAILGEVVPCDKIYTYEDKYFANKARLIYPANIPSQLKDNMKKTAIRIYKILNCKDMARIEFLLEEGHENFYFNNLHTVPKFASISIYPKLWEASGISYAKLLDILIDSAIQNHKKKQLIKL